MGACLAIPGRLLGRRDGPSGLPFGRVSFGSVVKEVCLAYTPEAQPGDYLVVHIGSVSSLKDCPAESWRSLLRGRVAAGHD